MASVFPTGNYETAFLTTASAAGQLLYTVPPAYLAILITQIKATNTTAGSLNVQASAVVSGVARVVTKLAAVAANDAFDDEFKPLVIKTGDQVTITATGVFHVFMSFVAQARI